MKRSIVYAFATMLLAVGVLSAASTTASHNSVKPVNGIVLPHPTCC